MTICFILRNQLPLRHTLRKLSTKRFVAKRLYEKKHTEIGNALFGLVAFVSFAKALLHVSLS